MLSWAGRRLPCARRAAGCGRTSGLDSGVCSYGAGEAPHAWRRSPLMSVAAAGYKERPGQGSFRCPGPDGTQPKAASVGWLRQPRGPPPPGQGQDMAPGASFVLGIRCEEAVGLPLTLQRLRKTFVCTRVGVRASVRVCPLQKLNTHLCLSDLLAKPENKKGTFRRGTFWSGPFLMTLGFSLRTAAKC